MGHRQERWLRVGGTGQQYGAQQEGEGQKKVENVLEGTVSSHFCSLFSSLIMKKYLKGVEGGKNIFSPQYAVPFIIYLNQTRVKLV